MRRCRGNEPEMNIAIQPHIPVEKPWQWTDFLSQTKSSPAQTNTYTKYWKRYPGKKPVLDTETLAEDFGNGNVQKVTEVKIAMRIYLHYKQNTPRTAKEKENYKNAKFILEEHEIDIEKLFAAKSFI